MLFIEAANIPSADGFLLSPEELYLAMLWIAEWRVAGIHSTLKQKSYREQQTNNTWSLLSLSPSSGLSENRYLYSVAHTYLRFKA